MDHLSDIDAIIVASVQVYPSDSNQYQEEEAHIAQCDTCREKVEAEKKLMLQDTQGFSSEHQIAITALIRGEPEEAVLKAREHLEKCPRCYDRAFQLETNLRRARIGI